ncbi:MAG: DMT family transporter [Candidatus Caldarchaeum sp.]
MRRLLYLVQGAAAGFFFGTAAVFVRYLSSLDAFTIAFGRVLIAGLVMVLLGLLVYRSKYVEDVSRNWRKYPLLGFFLGLHFIFFTLGVQNTSVVNATTLVNTTPAMAMVLGWAFKQVKPSGLNTAGLLMTFLGSASMTFGELSYNPQQISGDAFALAGALAWAVYLVVGKSVREGGNVLSAAGPIYLSAAVATGLAALIVGGLKQPRGDEILPLLGLAFFPTVLGHSLQFSSLKKLFPYEASALALLEPIVATLLAAAVLNEVVDPAFYLSAAIIITGIYMVVR